jgi:phage-related baseplate assembly protein
MLSDNQSTLAAFLRGLPRPEFIGLDAQQVVQDSIDQVQQLTGKQLYPAQVERLLIDYLAYREMHLRHSIQYAAEQNLVSFADGTFLDYLGELVGCYRLSDKPAVTTLRFTLDKVYAEDITIPKGTKAGRTNADASLNWVTTQAKIIRGTINGGSPLDTQGKPYADVAAEASITGLLGNGFLPGEIHTPLTDIRGLASVENITQSSFGAPTEDDDRFRQRIRLAPERFSNGSRAGYEFLVYSTDQTISDVQVYQTTPGRVNIVFITTSGLPSTEMISRVASAVRPDRDRPLTDWVSVVAPTRVPYDVTLNVKVLKDAIPTRVQEQIQEQLEGYKRQWQLKLGKDLVPEQFIGLAMRVSGVYECKVASPAYHLMQPNEWGDMEDIQINILSPTVDY